jgi:hypothetical protein
MLSRAFAITGGRANRICIESLIESHEHSHPFLPSLHSVRIPSVPTPRADDDKGEHEEIAAVLSLIFYLFCFNVLMLCAYGEFFFSITRSDSRAHAKTAFFFGREKCVLRWFVCVL